jgi:hypothetical protein
LQRVCAVLQQLLVPVLKEFSIHIKYLSFSKSSAKCSHILCLHGSLDILEYLCSVAVVVVVQGDAMVEVSTSYNLMHIDVR